VQYLRKSQTTHFAEIYANAAYVDLKFVIIHFLATVKELTTEVCVFCFTQKTRKCTKLHFKN